MRKRWTAKQDEDLRRYWAFCSVAETARLMGKTYHSIKHRAHRLKLPAKLKVGKAVPPWSEDEMATLRKMWESGKSAGVIAQVLGRTRNGVLGKLHREGWTGLQPDIHWTYKTCLKRDPFSYSKGPRASSVMRRRQKALQAGDGSPRKRKKKKKAPVVPQLSYVAPHALKRHVLELKNDDCRYPIGSLEEGGITFCGHEAKAGQSYCPHHYNLTHERK